uniref:Uncharacterized protein n=1 Tax=Anguilla anguilla TaxID=7936 RepID=A0A0E9WM89_ANGAN
MNVWLLSIMLANNLKISQTMRFKHLFLHCRKANKQTQTNKQTKNKRNLNFSFLNDISHDGKPSGWNMHGTRNILLSEISFIKWVKTVN